MVDVWGSMDSKNSRRGFVTSFLGFQILGFGPREFSAVAVPIGTYRALPTQVGIWRKPLRQKIAAAYWLRLSELCGAWMLQCRGGVNCPRSSVLGPVS